HPRLDGADGLGGGLDLGLDAGDERLDAFEVALAGAEHERAARVAGEVLDGADGVEESDLAVGERRDDEDEPAGGVQRVLEAADVELLWTAGQKLVEHAAEDEAAGGADAGPVHDHGGDAHLAHGAEDAVGGVG